MEAADSDYYKLDPNVLSYLAFGVGGAKESSRQG